MAESLSSLLAASFADAARHPTVARTLGRRRSRVTWRYLWNPEADARLVEVIQKYRTGDRSIWSPVLLELLSPVLVKRLERYEPPAGCVYDAEDIRQMLLVEVLEICARRPLEPGTDFVARRVLLDAAKEVTRAIRRENRIQDLLEPPLEEDDDDEEEEEV